jgi:haloalkane dehalogenase
MPRMTEGQAPASEAAPLDPPWLDRTAYPFARHDAQLAAGRMHYLDEGTGPVVLFVHGTPTWSFEFRRSRSGSR